MTQSLPKELEKIVLEDGTIVRACRYRDVVGNEFVKVTLYFTDGSGTWQDFPNLAKPPKVNGSIKKEKL